MGSEKFEMTKANWKKFQISELYCTLHIVASNNTREPISINLKEKFPLKLTMNRT